MLMSEYMIILDSVEEVQQDNFSVVYDSSQYHIPSRDTGINYYVTKDSHVIKKEEGEEILTFPYKSTK